MLNKPLCRTFSIFEISLIFLTSESLCFTYEDLSVPELVQTCLEYSFSNH